MKIADKSLRRSLTAAIVFAASVGGASAQQLGYAPSSEPLFEQFQANANTAAAAPSDADLAKQLANPIANLISVPLQNNLDFGGGASHAGTQYILNIQPVIPFKLNDDWNLIVRTIVPVTDVVNILPYDAFGIGDTVQSFFFSPAKPTIIWGAPRHP
jgi:hypothetical protein